MKSILVPTDFSDQAGHALDLAKQLASENKASILLLHIVEQPGSHYLTAVSGGAHENIDNVYVLKLIERVKVQLQTLVNKLANEGIEASYKIKIGNPFKHISSQIKSEEYQLIVMGTLGISGISEVLVGSNTEKVIRHVNCPVIALKQHVTLTHVKNIVLGVNYNELSKQLADNIKTVQDWFTAKVHLVAVNTPGNFLIQRDVIKALTAFIEKYQIPHYTINIYSDITEEEGIVHFSEDHDADMIAMVTHNRTGLSHLLAGSLTEDVVNHAVFPVVSFPIKAGSSKKQNVDILNEEN